MSQPKADPCLVLIMHIPVAAAFQQCAAHVLGAQAAKERLMCFDIQAIAQTDHEVERISATILKERSEHVVLLNDLYGATPYRVAQKVSQYLRQDGKQVSLVAGLSLPMLLKAMTDTTVDGFDAYISRIAETAQRGAVIE